VFAETDIVNLVKSGIPSSEILCSLVDAIVSQNLSILSRGSTLPHKVILLGGPNAHLPVLRDCWRTRIQQSWQLRGYDYPTDIQLDELIFVPDNAHLYAAFGACLYGLENLESKGRFCGVRRLVDFISNMQNNILKDRYGPPLVHSQAERDAFTADFSIPPFKPQILLPGETIKAYLGIDGGSTSSKAVLIDEAGKVLFKTYMISKGNPIEDTKSLMVSIRGYIEKQGAKLSVTGVGTTGYAGGILKDCLAADTSIVETIAHLNAAQHHFDKVDVVCDVGGQDIKVLFVKNGEIHNYRLSNQCSAGNGMLLQSMAEQFSIPIEQYAEHAFNARISPEFNYGCAVFLDADRVNFQKEGYTRDELLAGLARVLPKNIWQYIVQTPQLAKFGRNFVLQGGTQYNLAAVKAQYDYIIKRVPKAAVHIHPHPGEAGAIGAALEARRFINSGRKSQFIGIEQTINLSYKTRNDDSTICSLCRNSCKRTFIDAKIPGGFERRIISGFSCEHGRDNVYPSLKKLAYERRALNILYPNLVSYEANLAFQHFSSSEELPKNGTLLTNHRPASGIILRYLLHLREQHRFERSSLAAEKYRRSLRIGIPRVLDMYSTAPLWRTFFETLGLQSSSVIFSDRSSEALWREGAYYGSNDPCFPAKVAQAHIHNLLYNKQEHKKLDYIFFPAITHIPTFVHNVMDSATCPIVSGTPLVLQAAFTREVDFFARANLEYVCPAVTLTESDYFIQQMFKAWGKRLQASYDEIKFACECGLKALNIFNNKMEHHGQELIERLEVEKRVGILMLGRPYHNDPGINHDILNEFQTQGFPILTIRSIPKDPKWLARWFEVNDGQKEDNSALSVSDVWPENYSANSVQMVWAAKFAARHPNIAVLDLSSFKCGQDAPTYGLIDSIITAAKTPYSAIHDIDANKPIGTIKIRIETFIHTLRKYEEKLQDKEIRQRKLKPLPADKSNELSAMREK